MENPLYEYSRCLKVKPPKGIYEARLKKLGFLIGRPLPTDYQLWFQLCGSCHVGALDLDFLTDTSPSGGSLVELRKFLPFVFQLGIPLTVDLSGNFFVLLDQHKNQPVAQVEATSADVAECVVASSLERFLCMVCEAKKTSKDDWWLDEQFVKKHDPGIANCSDLDLPWADESAD